jgi:HEAT repeat protein
MSNQYSLRRSREEDLPPPQDQTWVWLVLGLGGGLVVVLAVGGTVLLLSLRPPAPVAVAPPRPPVLQVQIGPGAINMGGPGINIPLGGPADLDQAVTFLGGNALEQRLALEWLKKQPIDPKKQSKVAAALEQLLNGNDRNLAQESLEVLARWATKEQVPALLRAADDNNPFIREGAVGVLGPLKDDRAVVPLARMLANARDREAAGRALIAMGPMAEAEVRKLLDNPDAGARAEAARVLRQIGKADPARDEFTSQVAALIEFGPAAEDEVVKYLDHARFQTREAACQVLREVGTRKSLPALQAALTRANREKYLGFRQVAEAAQAATTAIEGRGK